MILEIASLDIQTDAATKFEAAFKIASSLTSAMPGYISQVAKIPRTATPIHLNSPLANTRKPHDRV